MSWSGNELLLMGAKQGPMIGRLLKQVNDGNYTRQEVEDAVMAELDNEPQTLPLRRDDEQIVYSVNIQPPIHDAEFQNLQAVLKTMSECLRTPVAVDGWVMPDACPAGPVGTIPVGGVVALDNAIAPGMHSADICCSVMATVVDDVDPADLLDAAHAVTHFGPGGRQDEIFRLPDWLEKLVEGLPYQGLAGKAKSHFGTQGDGNHFLYVGTLESTGQTVMVTHHGSRGLGASLYKQGMAIAEQYRRKLSPETLKQNAWIPFDTQDGREYWRALHVVREWTKANHLAIHYYAIADVTGLSKVTRQFWNEHNFVFRDGDRFLHAKGATPVNKSLMPDNDGVQIIPLNMAEPILFVTQGDDDCGFAPHGAGRNYSRTQHKRDKLAGGATEAEIFEAETAGIDARFYSGNIDISELPSAYKNAAQVQADMEYFGLAKVVDRVLPHGCIMAGDWERDAPWRRGGKAL